LRALGHEVVFFVDRPRGEARHRPEYHYPDVPYPYPEWIHEIKPSGRLRHAFWPSAVHREVLRSLEKCDGAILNGLALSLGAFLHRPVIGLLTGSDLDVYANLASVKTLAAAKTRFDATPGVHFLKQLLFRRLIKHQRAGIANCCLVEYAIPGLLPDADALLDDIGIGPAKRACFMLTDVESLPPLHHRSSGAIRIFCATRLQWRQRSSGAQVSVFDNKGTGIMLEGLQKFVTGASLPIQIDLIRVGADVAEVEKKIVELGLESKIHWHEELTQTDFLDKMTKADVVLENFGMDGGIGMAGRDALARGIPLIAWGKSHVFERVLGEPLPIYEARTGDEICARLNEIVNDPAGVERYSIRARDFAERWFSPRRAAERCIAAFEQARVGGAIG